MGRSNSLVVVVGVIAVVVLSMTVVPASAAGEGDGTGESTLHVELTDAGDATVSLVTAYDLDDDDERAAFESLETDESAQTTLRDRFSDRLTSVAEDGPGSITDAAVDVQSDGDGGTVTVSVTWTDLAASEGDTLVLTEPFASGFESEESVTVTVPAEWSIESANPSPDELDGETATWYAGTALDGFELVTAPDAAGDATDDTDSTASDDGVPGFGPVAGVFAVALASLLLVVVSSRSR